jgi:predicted branched-subunit amino acid permease
MTTFLVIIAILAAIIGAVSLSPATSGVGIICIACFLGILARLTQASDHHAVNAKNNEPKD